uniref:VWFA domain-containing protein n=1 Tax=Sphenodon punctatus TaxID=8508 RepID=A0A8D0GV62_SPHPU
MNTEQFSKIKEFMIDVMKKLSNGTIRFAAVQFSEEPKVEFDFKDYSQNPNPEKLLANVRHMTSLTNTFKAIEYVAEQVFTPARGLRDEAKRVIVMITDGDATDTGNVEAAKKNGITRYVIGVGNNFGGHDTQRYLSQFASEPVSQYVKVLRSFEELKDLFSELQEKIYAIEGTNDKNIFHLELSLSGFSAHLSKGRVVLGAVGADNWAGGLFDMMGEKTEETFKFIPSPLPKEQMKDAYLGYALTSLHHQERVLYAVGAPRYIHEGRVVIFDVDPTTSNWTQKQHIAGTQIGSYFGSVLCSVDLEGDGQTDFLLVGAPQFFSEHQGGQVYVYSWAEDQLIPSGQLYGDLGHPLGRFGAAISELTDINGDGLTDTAVGAPLEDDESGAVYIYNSQKGALSEHYSQRINGAVLSPGLKYFGQSINGWTDLNDDSLTDITVVAQGKVFVLSSRPIVMVLPFAEFSPMEIPIEQVECTGSLVAREDIELKVCFNTSRVTQSYSGPLLANLTYVMEIDPKRMKGRGIFPNGMRKTSGNISISVGGHCVRETIQIPNCLEDYVSAIHVALNFSLLENSHAAISVPVLEPLSNVLLVEIPFKKNCGEDEVCKADLIITVHPSGYGLLPGGAVLQGAGWGLSRGRSPLTVSADPHV